VVAHAASEHDRTSARRVLAPRAHGFSRLRKGWADGGDFRSLGEWLWNLRARRKDRLELVEYSGAGFAALPKRWIVERTFACLGRCRRLSKDYEYLTETSETTIQIAMIDLMLYRLTQ
jgi:putative transposase